MTGPRPYLASLASLIVLASCHRENLARTVFITMADNTFSPSVMRVPVGGHIEFRNWGGQLHNAIAVDGGWKTDGPAGKEELKSGEWAGVTFDQPGVYHYFCRFHGTPDGKRGMVGTVIVGDVQYVADGTKAGQLDPVAEPSGVTRRVPEDFPTIQAAVDAAAPGDLVLVGEGTYKEEVMVTTPSVTVRGVDRNKVILDGEFQRANGFTVYADAVAIENLTAQNYRLNGFFYSGVKGYRGSFISAINNGDYGIYAFDAYEGVLDHALGSGSPDAGLYVGGCYPCRTVLDRVWGIMNPGQGYSGTNSGGDLYIINSVFSNNASGIVPNTFDIEPHPPQRETTIIGNVVTDNRGSGVRIMGGNRNLVERNLITGNGQYGVLIYATQDQSFYPSTDNIVRDNVILGSGSADLASSGLGNLNNCFSENQYRTTLPWGLALLQRCGGMQIPVIGDPSAYFGAISGRNRIFSGRHEFGEEWKTWPRPEPQASMPGGAAAPVRPPLHPFDGYPLGLDRIQRPTTAPRLVIAATGRR